MDQTVKLLQSLVENARMGMNACEQLLKKSDDGDMRREIMQEKQLYENAARDAEERLFQMGIKPQPKGPMARMGMWMGMQMDTMMNQSPCHFADILIQGATMGIVEITKARNDNPDADPEAQGIASALLTAQQDSIERLKNFLREKEQVH